MLNRIHDARKRGYNVQLTNQDVGLLMPAVGVPGIRLVVKKFGVSDIVIDLVTNISRSRPGGQNCAFAAK